MIVNPFVGVPPWRFGSVTTTFQAPAATVKGRSDPPGIRDGESTVISAPLNTTWPLRVNRSRAPHWGPAPDESSSLTTADSSPVTDAEPTASTTCKRDVPPCSDITLRGGETLG